jgi:hypothetical protein
MASERYNDIHLSNGTDDIEQEQHEVTFILTNERDRECHIDQFSAED